MYHSIRNAHYVGKVKEILDRALCGRCTRYELAALSDLELALIDGDEDVIAACERALSVH